MLSLILLCTAFSDVIGFRQRSPYENEDYLQDEGFGFMNAPKPPQQTYNPTFPNFGPPGLRMRPGDKRRPLVPNSPGEGAYKHDEGSTTYDLAHLEERLTKSNKWSEFHKLLREEKKKHEGTVLKDWEADAEKWAIYSRHLLDKPEEKNKKTPGRESNFRVPSLGMGQYWGGGDEENHEEKKNPARDTNYQVPITRMGQYWGGNEEASDRQSIGKELTKMSQYLGESEREQVNKFLLGHKIGEGTQLVGQQAWQKEFQNMDKYLRENKEMTPQPSPYTSKDISTQKNAQPALLTEKPIQLTGFSSGSSIKELALKKLALLQKQADEEYASESNETSESPKMLEKAGDDESNPTNKQIMRLPKVPKPTTATITMPKIDDFNTPIKWVPFNSYETGDGLAKVTDPDTGRNRQFVINGTIFVPVIDYNLERLGWTTTPPTTVAPPSLTTENIALRVVVNTVDLDQIDERDWLIFEIVLGSRKHEKTCETVGCHARCSKLGCESLCNGDTCSSGCVGTSCSAYCRGPGCIAMCIGTYCTTKCEGLNCEARCRGKECEATCRQFSCSQTTNGVFKKNAVAWSETYPEYNENHAPNPSTF